MSISNGAGHCMIPHDLKPAIAGLPERSKNRGWMTDPPALRPFKNVLYSIPNTTKCFHVPLLTHDHCHLFCDGTALAPTVCDVRLAVCGVTLAGSTSQDQCRPVSWGGPSRQAANGC